MMSWHLNAWKAKIWLSQEWKALSKWNKKHFPLFHKCSHIIGTLPPGALYIKGLSCQFLKKGGGGSDFSHKKGGIGKIGGLF